MKLVRPNILIIAAVAAVLSVSCAKDETEVIPRGQMARIYSEMLVMDQWIQSTPGTRVMADTSRVYEPILEKYGYSSENYRASVDYYMNDPERFSRIFRSAGDILDKRIDELNRELKLQQARDNLPKIKSDFKISDYAPYLTDEPYVHYYDSIAVELDSATWTYRLRPVDTADTLYDGVRIIMADTLAVAADTLCVDDTLLQVDSRPEVNEIKINDKILKMDSSIRKDTFRKKEVK